MSGPTEAKPGRWRWTIGRLIFAGFLFLVVLVVGSSGVSVMTMFRIERSFDSLRSLSALSHIAQTVDRGVSQLRLAVGAYLHDPSQALQAKVDGQATRLRDEIAAARRSFADPAVRARLDSIDERLGRYVEGFGRIAALNAERRGSFAALVTTGERIQSDLGLLIARSFETSDFEGSNRAARLRGRYLDARAQSALAVSDMTSDKAQRVVALRGAFKEIDDEYRRLERVLREADDRALAHALRDTTARFQALFLHLADLGDTIQRVASEVVDAQAELIIGVTEMTREQVQRDEQAVAEALTRDLAVSVDQTLIIAALCVLGGVAAAAWVVRRTVRPLGRITETMTDLAGGALGTAVPFRDQDNEIGAMARATDVFKNAMVDIKAARDEAEAAARAKSEFLAVMSHEIRTPMNGVLTMADLLVEYAQDDEQRGIVQIVRDSSRALLGIINDILDFSKIEAGKLQLEAVEFDLEDVVVGVADLLSRQAAEKGIDLVPIVSPVLPARIVADPTRFRQILLNLVGNAIKFTDAGSVTVRAEPVPEGMRLSVTDTGIGLTPAQRTRLFQPFAQGDSSTARKYGGTGLGLSICRRLVELMGGRIGVAPGPRGEGSTFWFIVPVVAGAGPADDLPRLDAFRVAVAGVSPAMREAVTAYLAAAGAAISEGDADLRIVGPDAGDLAGRTVLIAARGSTSLRAEAARLGFAAAVAEPIHRRELVRTAAVALGLAEPRVAAGLPETGSGRRLPRRAEALAAGALVLVAEDNHTNRVVVRKLLDRLGYQADIVDDGAAAWAALQQTPYALLITDCHMPGMDGYELTAKIRTAEQAGGRRLPIVALTADALPDTVRKCLGAGMDAHLAKPIDIPALDAVLSRFARALPSPAAAAEDAAEPVAIDPAILDLGRLKRTFGSFDEAAAELLADFLGDLPGAIDRIADALARAAWKPAAERAHTLKGAAGSIGAGQLGDALGALQAALGRRDDQEAERCLSEVRKVAAGLVEASAPLLAASLV